MRTGNRGHTGGIGGVRGVRQSTRHASRGHSIKPCPEMMAMPSHSSPPQCQCTLPHTSGPPGCAGAAARWRAWWAAGRPRAAAPAGRHRTGRDRGRLLEREAAQRTGRAGERSCSQVRGQQLVVRAGAKPGPGLPTACMQLARQQPYATGDCCGQADWPPAPTRCRLHCAEQSNGKGVQLTTIGAGASRMGAANSSNRKSRSASVNKWEWWNKNRNGGNPQQ